MLIRSHRPRGIKLIELMVIVAISGAVIGVGLRAILAARAAGRRAQCTNNMRQLGLSLLNFSSSKNRFPNAGTFFDDPSFHQGDPTKSNIARAILDPGASTAMPSTWLRNWIIDILHFLDSSDLANQWNHQQSYLSITINTPYTDSNFSLSSTDMGVLNCPDDTPIVRGQGNVSYVVNGGFARWPAIPIGWDGAQRDGRSKNGGTLQWAPPGSDWRETQAIGKKLGVMFLGTQTGDQPWDISTRPHDITDGASSTLLLAENTLTGSSTGTRHSGGQKTNWACPLPNFSMFIASDNVCHSRQSTTDCLAGALRPTPQGKDGPGWSWANRPGTFENLGYGQALSIEGSFPFANSGHRDGGNFAFCDGAVRFLSNSIDGAVYARLISPAGVQLPPGLRQKPMSPDALALD